MRFPFSIALGLVLSLGLAGCNEQGAAPQAAAAPPPTEVTVVTLVAQPVPLTGELPGRTAPYRIAEVRPQVGGVILKRLFEEGSEVTAGQSLYLIDPAPFQASLDSANATLSTAKATLDRNKATLASAVLLAERYRPLVGAGAVSKQAYDDAVASQKQAEADVASGKAAIETAQASIESAKINLAYTNIVSPIAGRTGRSTVTEGALVTASQAASLVTVQQLDPIYVDIVQPSSQILRLRHAVENGTMKSGNATSGPAQAETHLLLEDGSAYAPAGKLQFSEVTVDESTGSVTLRAIFPNTQRLLLPGMYVHAQVQEGVAENALLVPQRAVTHNQKGEATVYVVGTDGKADLRVIQADRTVGAAWLVANDGDGATRGLRAGEKVVVEGLQKIGPGAPVHAVEYSTAASPAVTSAP